METERIKEVLYKKGVEGILIFSQENIRYLTGFSGSEGFLLVCEGEELLMVDGRYITQAQEEARSCRITLVEKGIKGVAAHVSPLGLKHVGFEAAGISVALFEQLHGELEGVELVPIKEELEQCRGKKTTQEITSIRGAIDIAEWAWESVLKMLKPGTKENELALELEYKIKKAGSEGVAFDLIVASGPRSALPHAQPAPRSIEEGDLVLFDFGCCCRGYNSDETRTVALSQASEEQKRVYQVVREAHDKAIELVRPGIRLAEIDAAARGHIHEAGYGEHFGHGTGHGVGLAVHEWPAVGKDSKDVAEEGMVFTIEPGIYIPGWGGVRIEDMVLVTVGGCEVLTTISKDLMVVI